MTAREALEKLVNENADAKDQLSKIAKLPQEEAEKALREFAETFGIQLEAEDFELTPEELEKASGGGAEEVIGIIIDLIGIIGSDSDYTGREKTGRK